MKMHLVLVVSKEQFKLIYGKLYIVNVVNILNNEWSYSVILKLLSKDKVSSMLILYIRFIKVSCLRIDNMCPYDLVQK